MIKYGYWLVVFYMDEYVILQLYWHIDIDYYNLNDGDSQWSSCNFLHSRVSIWKDRGEAQLIKL